MRGEKFCKYCKSRNGPRSFACRVCGRGFTCKGITHPDIEPGAVGTKQEKQVVETAPEADALMALVRPCDDPSERQMLLKHWGPTAKSFESLCGNYRIRYTTHFMGVAIDDGRYYKVIMKKKGWELPTGKYRFRSLTSAIKKVQRLQHGKADPGSRSRLSVHIRKKARQING